MSAYSTREFSRAEAIGLLAAAIHNPETPDDMLADMLDAVLRPSFQNAIISTDDPGQS